jgi:hypothetical protein
MPEEPATVGSDPPADRVGAAVVEHLEGAVEALRIDLVSEETSDQSAHGATRLCGRVSPRPRSDAIPGVC